MSALDDYDRDDCNLLCCCRPTFGATILVGIVDLRLETPFQFEISRAITHLIKG
jgi:hypothetical protein